MAAVPNPEKTATPTHRRDRVTAQGRFAAQHRVVTQEKVVTQNGVGDGGMTLTKFNICVFWVNRFRWRIPSGKRLVGNVAARRQAQRLRASLCKPLVGDGTERQRGRLRARFVW